MAQYKVSIPVTELPKGDLDLVKSWDYHGYLNSVLKDTDVEANLAVTFLSVVDIGTAANCCGLGQLACFRTGPVTLGLINLIGDHAERTFRGTNPFAPARRLSQISIDISAVRAPTNVRNVVKTMYEQLASDVDKRQAYSAYIIADRVHNNPEFSGQGFIDYVIANKLGVVYSTPYMVNRQHDGKTSSASLTVIRQYTWVPPSMLKYVGGDKKLAPRKGVVPAPEVWAAEWEKIPRKVIEDLTKPSKRRAL